MWDARMGNLMPNLDFRRSSLVVWYVGRIDGSVRVEPLERLKALVLGSLGATAPCMRT